MMNLDIAPAQLDATGIKPPSGMQGKLMVPLLKSKNADIRDAVYYHYYENGEHSVSPHLRRKHFKII